MRSSALSSHPRRLWLPVVLWAAVIFAASSVSSPPNLPPHVTDKMVHSAIYAVLAALCLRALAGGGWRGVTFGVAAVSVIIATSYGLTDEFHQRFVPGRTADLLDVAADFVGSSAAALIALVAAWLRRRKLG